MNDATRHQLLAEVDSDIARLETERQELLLRIESELEELRRVRTYLSRRLAAHTASLPAPTPLAHANGAAHTNGSGASSDPASRWHRVIARILKDAQRPMRAKEIAEAMVTRYGIAQRGGRVLERKSYTVMARRQDLFVNLGRGRWTLPELAHLFALHTVEQEKPQAEEAADAGTEPRE